MEINLSKYTLRLRKTPTGMIEVYDKLRKTYVAYTPEEDVRQRFIEFLNRSERNKAPLRLGYS